MFTKKKVAPTTVAEAIAPFKEVKDNLIDVIKKRSERRLVSERRIKDAEAYAAQVKRDETAASNEALAEIEQAEKIADALATILGEEPVAKSVSSNDDERAQKIAEARENGTDTGEGLRPGRDG